MQSHSWLMLLCSRNEHNTVKQLHIILQLKKVGPPQKEMAVKTTHCSDAYLKSSEYYFNFCLYETKIQIHVA